MAEGGVIETHNRRPTRRPRLSERDRAVLEIERAHGPAPEAWPAKAVAARRELGLTPDGYRLVLFALIDDPAAHAAAPEVIESLRELRRRQL